MLTHELHVHTHSMWITSINISQGIHTDCHNSKQPGYSPSKILLTNQAAIEAYEKALCQTQIYRYAESYCRVKPVCFDQLKCKCGFTTQCRDTYWVESFNHQLLMYLPKRIHFGTSTFLMHMNLALLYWVCKSIFLKNGYIITL